MKKAKYRGKIVETKKNNRIEALKVCVNNR